jgi:AraC-like DNA-binding protein
MEDTREVTPESMFIALKHILLEHLRTGRDLRDRFSSLIAAAICILAERHQWCLSTQRRLGSGGLARWQEERAKAYMETHLGESLAVDDVARLCGMSTPHFSRSFKITTGLPPYRWLVKRRIERAKELLRSGSNSLADI